MAKEYHMKEASWLLIFILFIYFMGYATLRLTGQAMVFHYGTGDRELWSNIDRIPVIGPSLQTMYLPLIHSECALRNLEWSP